MIWGENDYLNPLWQGKKLHKLIKNSKFITSFSSGLKIGLICLAVNFIIDQLMFSAGPMKMAFVDYLKDIGVTYLLIPIIPTGFGSSLEKKKLETISGSSLDEPPLVLWA